MIPSSSLIDPALPENDGRAVVTPLIGRRSSGLARTADHHPYSLEESNDG
jgi:hypothetical protein